MAYKHGIEVTEKATSFPSPMSTQHGVQVIFGTAPVNLTENPAAAVNKPVKAATFEEAAEALGYSEDWKNYTLCQSMYASFQLFQINPVVFVNVLDPAKHAKALEERVYEIKNHQAVVDVQGILKDRVKVSAQTGAARTGTARTGEAQAAEGESELVEDIDYILDFDSYGRLVVTALSAGRAYDVTEISVSGEALAPELVTEEDLIGAYDAATGQETGLETLRQVYPRHGIVPGVIMAPGWTNYPNVGAALQGKCEDINGAFRCTCLLDLDTDLAVKYTDCENVKKAMGYEEEHSIVLWPKLQKDGRIYDYSAVYGAMMSYNTASNGDVPYIYPSNKELNVDGAVLADGNEILLDQVQAGILNGAGIVTAFRDSSWKAYGNNTGCYPSNTDPKDRWIGCRRMFDYVANYFIAKYRQRLDESMNRRLVDDIVNSFNIWGNSLTAAGMCAGIYAEYRPEENRVEDVLEGHMKLRIYFAPYTPAEYIHTMMEFDVSALENVMAEEG